MKKLVIISMLFSIIQFANAQEKIEIPKLVEHEIGQFCSRGKLFNAKAAVTEDTTIVYYYLIEAQTAFAPLQLKNVIPVIVIWCPSDITQIIDSVANKYHEWAKVVQDNHIKEMEIRNINVRVPITQYALDDLRMEDYLQVGLCGKKNFSFWLNSKGKPIVGYNIKVDVELLDRRNKKYSEDLFIYLAFEDDEIDKFAEFLEPESVKGRIRMGKNDLIK